MMPETYPTVRSTILSSMCQSCMCQDGKERQRETLYSEINKRIIKRKSRVGKVSFSEKSWKEETYPNSHSLLDILNVSLSQNVFCLQLLFFPFFPLLRRKWNMVGGRREHDKVQTEAQNLKIKQASWRSIGGSAIRSRRRNNVIGRAKVGVRTYFWTPRLRGTCKRLESNKVFPDK